MSSSQREQFFNRPSLSNLPQSEKEKRWKQHLAAKKGVRGRKNPQAKNPTRKGGKTKPKDRAKRKDAISDCSLHYALALSDPWSCPQQPCIPDTLTLESFRFQVRAKGTAQVGTGGVGYVSFNPFNPYTFSAGNTYSGVYTDSTFTGTNYQTSGIGINQLITDASQPYTNAVNYDQAYRVVGAGVKVCYAGNEMNRQGMWTCIRDPSNSPFVAGTTQQAFLLYRETSVVPVDKDWHAALYKPATASDITYAPRGLDIDGTATGANLFYSGSSLMIMITGGTPGASFQFDCIAHFQMTGRGLPFQEKSHSDPIGFSLVSSAVSSHQPETNPTNNAMAFAQAMDSNLTTFSFVDSVASVAERLMPIISQAATIAAPFLL